MIDQPLPVSKYSKEPKGASILREPFIVQYLRDQIRTWKGNEREFVIEPKDASFSRIECVGQEIRFGFGELKWDLSAVVPMVPKEEMNEEARKLFRRLKGMECQLKWEGFGKRKPKFVMSPTLLGQRKLLPDLEPSAKLADNLNGKREVLDPLKIVKPDHVFFILHTSFPQTGDYLFRIFQRYYENPEEVTWIITLRRAFFRGEMARYERLFRAIYYFFSEAADALRTFRY